MDNINKKIFMKSQESPYLVLQPSVLPIFLSFHIGVVLLSTSFWFHPFENSFFSIFWNSFFYFFMLFFFDLFFIIFLWLKELYYESTIFGFYTSAIRKNLRLGCVLFILSEVMLFFSFFWALFHSSLNPEFLVGSVWPMDGIIIFYFCSIPLLNSLLLVTSGFVVTWAHQVIFLKQGQRSNFFWLLFLTIILGLIFLVCQGIEYTSASFGLTDSIYGTCFFMFTGFHGFHVLVGVIFLSICLYRHYKYQFLKESHLFFELAVIYWHFVDIVWLGLYICVYLWFI